MSFLTRGTGIAYGNAINWAHPLNRSLAGWWMTLPNRRSGARVWDLTRKVDGTFASTVSVTGPQGRPGGYGAIYLDGDTDYISVANHASHSGMDYLSIAMWIKPTLASPAGYGTLSSNWFGGGTNAWVWYQMNTGAFQYFMNSGFVTSATGLVVASTWQHVAFTYDQANIRSYVNGVLVSTMAKASGAVNATTNILRFGDSTGGAEEYQGHIDDIRLVRRVYSDGDIRQLYNLTRTGYQGLLNRVEVPWMMGAVAAAGDAVPQVWRQYRQRRVNF